MRDKFAGTPLELQKTIYALARCTSEDEFDRQVERARVDFASTVKLEKILRYIINIREQFVSAWFIDRGFPNHTQITSNPAEQFNKWARDERSLPIISFFEGVNSKWIEKLNTVSCCFFVFLINFNR